MSEPTRHTPGPWHLKLGSYGSPHEISWAPGKSYGLITRINTPGIQECREAPRTNEVEANARLVAAAPDLLEAVLLAEATIQRLRAKYELGSVDGTLGVLHAAIAKAEGK